MEDNYIGIDIVLGGGIISKQNQLFEDIYSNINESCSIGKAKLEKSKYGENSGIIGATKLCITKMKELELLHLKL